MDDVVFRFGLKTFFLDSDWRRVYSLCGLMTCFLDSGWQRWPFIIFIRTGDVSDWWRLGLTTFWTKIVSELWAIMAFWTEDVSDFRRFGLKTCTQEKWQLRVRQMKALKYTVFCNRHTLRCSNLKVTMFLDLGIGEKILCNVLKWLW